jgi:hypothetical protein
MSDVGWRLAGRVARTRPKSASGLGAGTLDSSTLARELRSLTPFVTISATLYYANVKKRAPFRFDKPIQKQAKKARNCAGLLKPANRPPLSIP